MSAEGIRLYDPTAEPRVVAAKLAARLESLTGKRIGILDNSKANAGTLMLAVAKTLQERYGVGAEEAEAGQAGEVLVDVGVADVIVRRRRERRLHLGQTVLEHREVRDQGEALPQLALMCQRPVRAGADDVAESLGGPYGGDRDDARRLADLQRAVDVEAHQGHRAHP